MIDRILWCCSLNSIKTWLYNWSMEWNRARKPIKLEKGRLSHDLWWYILIFNRIHEKSRTSVLLVIYVYGNTVDGSKMQQFYWFHIIYMYIQRESILPNGKPRDPPAQNHRTTPTFSRWSCKSWCVIQVGKGEGFVGLEPSVLWGSKLYA